jgi:hypothetical protein
VQLYVSDNGCGPVRGRLEMAEMAVRHLEIRQGLIGLAIMCGEVGLVVGDMRHRAVF